VPIVIIILYKILEYVLKIWNPFGIQIGDKSDQDDSEDKPELETSDCCSTEKKNDLKKTE